MRTLAGRLKASHILWQFNLLTFIHTPLALYYYTSMEGYTFLMPFCGIRRARIFKKHISDLCRKIVEDNAVALMQLNSYAI